VKEYMVRFKGEHGVCGKARGKLWSEISKEFQIRDPFRLSRNSHARP